jgi:hypothetical protein
MLRKSILVFSILCAAILIGCGKTETSNSNTAADNSNKTATGTTSTTASSGDKIGIPECDDYIAKYEACVKGRVPEVARAAMESSLKSARENWKKAAANEQSKGTLAAACKQANDQAAASMKGYGCTW